MYPSHSVLKHIYPNCTVLVKRICSLFLCGASLVTSHPQCTLWIYVALRKKPRCMVKSFMERIADVSKVRKLKGKLISYQCFVVCVCVCARTHTF